jgi:hypothetical protein
MAESQYAETTISRELYNTEVIFCQCGTPTCNITKHTLKGCWHNNTIDDTNIKDEYSIRVPLYAKMKYPFNINEFNFNFLIIPQYKYIIDKYSKFREFINDFSFNVAYYSNNILSYISFPIKIVYNILYYFTNNIYGVPDIDCYVEDNKTIHEWFPKWEFEKINGKETGCIITKINIPKKDLPLIKKIEYILYGYVKINYDIEKCDGEIYEYFGWE